MAIAEWITMVVLGGVGFLGIGYGLGVIATRGRILDALYDAHAAEMLSVGPHDRDYHTRCQTLRDAMDLASGGKK